MISWMSSDFCQIRPLAAVLYNSCLWASKIHMDLYYGYNGVSSFSRSFYPIFIILANNKGIH